MNRLLLALALAAPAPALAEEAAAPPSGSDRDCELDGLASGPISANAGDGDLGLVRRVCGRTEAALGGGGGLIIDTPHFYGMIAAAGALSGSYQLDRDTEAFGRIDFLQYRWIQNATITGSHLVLGGTSVGATRRFKLVDDAAPPFRFAAFGRVHLPTSFEYAGAWPIGIEPGASVEGSLPRGFGWHGGTAVALTAVPGGAGWHPRGQLSLLAGGDYTPIRYFSAALELATRFGPDRGFDQLTAGLGLRTRIYDVGIELGAVYPIAGGTRYTAAGMLRVSYRFPEH